MNLSKSLISVMFFGLSVCPVHAEEIEDNAFSDAIVMKLDTLMKIDTVMKMPPKVDKLCTVDRRVFLTSRACQEVAYEYYETQVLLADANKTPTAGLAKPQ